MPALALAAATVSLLFPSLDLLGLPCAQYNALPPPAQKLQQTIVIGYVTGYAEAQAKTCLEQHSVKGDCARATVQARGLTLATRAIVGDLNRICAARPGADLRAATAQVIADAALPGWANEDTR